MSVAIVTTMYNEEILAELFFLHYHWANEIHVLYDMDSTDSTLDICLHNKACVYPFKFPDMMDAGIKQKNLNTVFNALETDWGIMVDADEFVFDQVFSFQSFIEQLPGEIETVSAWLWNVYRHTTDKEIDVTKPPKWQRRHGDPNFEDWYNKHYIKRCIARPKLFSNFNIGCHDFNPNPDIPHLIGTHWKMADPELAITRRIKNGRDRQSKMNLSQNWQCHDFHITEEQILAECKLHENDPLLF